ANAQEALVLKNLILDYQEASGQLVNMDKSEIIYSRHVHQNIRDNIGQILPMKRVEQFSKYLGMPTQVGRSKKQ
ncbi:ribonuclease H protein, partial [Trifolium medium]|nr:ribonuclease H protein [Trifolium medium]